MHSTDPVRVLHLYSVHIVMKTLIFPQGTAVITIPQTLFLTAPPPPLDAGQLKMKGSSAEGELYLKSAQR